MTNAEQTARNKRNRSLAQDVHQAFVEWVKKLRFVKKDIPQDPGRRDLKEEPAARPSGGPSAERLPDDRERRP